MMIKLKLEEQLRQLNETDDYEVISSIGDNIWDITDEMDSSTDPAALPLLAKAIDSDASSYFINNAIVAVGKIGGELAETILLRVSDEYAAIDEEIFLKSKELLATINPTKYISDIDQNTQYAVIRELSKSKSLDFVKEVIGMTKQGVNLVNKLKMNLLWVALDSDNIELCKYLLDKGVDVSIKNAYGDSATEYAGKVGNATSTYLVQKMAG